MGEDFNALESEFSPLEQGGEKMKAKLPNFINVVIVVCVIIAALVSLGDISFTFLSVFNMSLLVAIIYLITSVIYRNNYRNGMNAGMLTDEYKNARREYDETKAIIYKKGIASKVSGFCLRYVEEDLKNYRTSILANACIEYGTYVDKYMKKSLKDLMKMKLSRREMECILKANRASGIKISSDVLLSGTGGRARRRGGLGISGTARQNIDFAFNMASRFLTAFLTGSVAVSVIIEPSWQTVAQWGIRMLPVVWSALVAYNSGVKNVLETAIPYLSRKTELLKIFISWAEAEA